MIGISEWYPIVISSPPKLTLRNRTIGYNPRLFENPEEFRPSRWYGKSDSDMTFFGFGPRACVGKKFSIAEAVCLLTLMLQEWKVEPIFNTGETPEMWRNRVLQGTLAGLAFGVVSVPLTFTRRTC
jgi:cytochrome P450